jgi:hypothetical protein
MKAVSVIDPLYEGVSESYGSKTHWTDSQNSDKTTSSCIELYHLQFSLQAASPESYGYTVVVVQSLCGVTRLTGYSGLSALKEPNHFLVRCMYLTI